MQKVFDQLNQKGIRFSKNLSGEDFVRIEKTYGVHFPSSLKEFYSFGVPYDPEAPDAFPQWSDYSPENIQKLKNRIHFPAEALKLAVQRGFWVPEWGDKPESDEKSVEVYCRLIKSAPKLIPIYSHRYIIETVPYQEKSSANPPVISAVGQDIIYYGRDLTDYLRNEFLREDFVPVDISRMQADFWNGVVKKNIIT